MRRAARTWLLALLACGAGWAAFLLCHYGAVQYIGKGDLSGNIVPARFLMAGDGACFLLTLLAGVVFLAFDHQARRCGTSGGKAVGWRSGAPGARASRPHAGQRPASPELRERAFNWRHESHAPPNVAHPLSWGGWHFRHQVGIFRK